MRRYKKKDYSKLNQILIGGFLVFLMIASVVGFVLNYSSGEGNPLNYNGYEFEVSSDQTFIFTEVNGKNYQFYNVPLNIEYLNLPSEAVDDINNAELVYFTFDSSDEINLPYAELIRFDLDNYMLTKNKFVASGVYNTPSGLYESFPVIDCENATKSTPVIKLINSTVTLFTYSDYCLEIQGTGAELVQSRDRLMFGLLGIIENG